MRRRRPSFWSLHVALGWAALSVFGCGLTLVDSAAEPPDGTDDLGASSGSPSPSSSGSSSPNGSSSGDVGSSSGAAGSSSSSGDPGSGSSGEPGIGSSSGAPGTGSSSGEPMVWPNQNLVRNPGAEQFDDGQTPSDWLGEHAYSHTYGVSGAPRTTDTPDAAQAELRFFMGTLGALRPNASQGEDGWLVQDVDLRPYAAQLAAGTHYQLGAWIGGWSDDRDRAEVKVTFLREAQELDSSDTLTVSRGDRDRKTKLLERSFDGAVPEDATTARVRIDFKHDNGKDTDGYVDNVSLTLRPAPPP